MTALPGSAMRLASLEERPRVVQPNDGAMVP